MIYDYIYKFKYLGEISTNLIEDKHTFGMLIIPPKKYMKSFYRFYYGHSTSDIPKEWGQTKYLLLILRKGKLERVYSESSLKSFYWNMLRSGDYITKNLKNDFPKIFEQLEIHGKDYIDD